MSKIQSKRVNALKTLILVIAIGVGHFLQTNPAHANIITGMPAPLIGPE